MDYSLKNLNFEKNFLDIGTGDGRYVYKSALLNPQSLYIGIDPALNLK
jgi:tRNA G46 methylase TrmB